MAVFILPPDMVGFYKSNIEYISSHAVDPDKRRYASAEEAARHYIDIDHYVKNGEDPFKVVPQKWNEAVEKYTEDTLKKYGIVPWHIDIMLRWLTKAFEEKDVNKILSLSADIGHYVSDAHVPLHTTENYNGQLTGQKGIHGLWESRIPELLAEDYDYLVGRAEYIEDPLKKIWVAVKKSHSYLDSVLLIEKDISLKIASDRKYVFESKGKTTSKQYSQEYALAYNQRMGDMVESRMRESIKMVGDIWYTAWVNAGQPDLDGIEKKLNLEKISEEQAEIESAFRKQKIKGRTHED